MKNKGKWIVVLGLVMLFTNACEQAEEKLSQELNEQVMTLHDHLMPQTEQIVQLKGTLDSLSHGKDSTHVKRLIQSLDKADQSMMDWMHQFSVDSLEKLEVKAKVIYLGKQLSQLKQVESITDSSLSAAKKYVQ
ncbi:MAG: hypothetical protein RL246_1905 [Bacteroidota bacterium]|jgi:hypothetical protein